MVKRRVVKRREGREEWVGGEVGEGVRGEESVRTGDGESLVYKELTEALGRDSPQSD